MTMRKTSTLVWVARGIAAASLIATLPLAAHAQDAGMSALQTGISIRANVDLVYLPSSGDQLQLTQTSFAAGAIGDQATPENVFDILNQAALAGLNDALAKGARSGRITVVASGCEVGVDGQALKAAAPIGIFVNTTSMDVGPDGKPVFITRVRFFPDMETAPQVRSPGSMQFDPRTFETIPWGQDGRR